jgi:hypothetical protein
LWDISEEKAKSIQYKISPYKAVHSADEPFSSFSFHPTIPQCLLSVTNTGTIRQIFVTEFPRMAVSPLGYVCTAQKKAIVEIQTNMEDYSSIMKQRADLALSIDVCFYYLLTVRSPPMLKLQSKWKMKHRYLYGRGFHSYNA